VELTVIRGKESLRLPVRLVEQEVAKVEGTPSGVGLWAIKPPKAVAGPPHPGLAARYEDQSHVLELKIDQQGKHLTVKDKRGAVVFDGPVNTPEQRKAVPELLRPKLELLESPPPPKVRPTPSQAAPSPDLS